MPVKVVPPVLLTQQLLSTKQQVGPITVMSGFMTKKGRTLNRWKQRWWQLLDNGYLFYFKSDDRLKILGQIDIARTCYDVRLGSGKCRVAFPRAAPSCCCISFAVLKRNYHVYTPTAGEAEKWAEAISDMSQVINRRVFAGVEHRKAPDPPGPSRPPSCPPLHQVKMARVRAGNGLGKSDSYGNLTRIEYNRSNTNLVSQKMMAISVPDYLNKIADDSSSLRGDGNLDSRLWLDGSPPPACESMVHPCDEPPAADISWGSPTTNRSSSSLNTLTGNTPIARRHSSMSPPPRERLHSLPSVIVMDYELLNDQQEDSTAEQAQVHNSTIQRSQSHDPAVQKVNMCNERLEHYMPSASVGDNVLHSSFEETRSLASSKGLSRSLVNIQSTESLTQTRPVPKPRKLRARAATETKVTCTLRLPEMRPRNNSEPPQIRPSEPPQIRPRKGNGALSKKPQHSSKSASGRRSRRISPPSTPPPPPPPTMDSGLPRKPAGPPKFTPPPPPLEEHP